MNSLVVTGGIATGKSTFCRLWAELEPDTVVHDADAAVHALYRNASVRAGIAKIFGAAVLLGDDDVDREMIRSVIAQSTAKKRALEQLIHPRVRAECMEKHGMAARQGVSWFLADIPLFFEAGAHKPVEDARVVVVACSRTQQLERLMARNLFDKDDAAAMVAMQAEMAGKMAAADHVIWNEGAIADLHRQARMLRDTLQSG